jgi:hypothetical protein
MDLMIWGSVALTLALIGIVVAVAIWVSDAVGRRREARYLKRTGRSS